jgi:beta-carotene ketolase (CrtW type)
MASFPVLVAQAPRAKQQDWTGLAWAIALLMAWGSSLVWLLTMPVTQFPWLVLPIILGRTLLQTGLFIVAHDAMHLSLLPRYPRLNHSVGRVAIGLYAFLSYRHCWMQHRRHHRQPGQPGDPDFHDGVHDHPVAWYIKFMGGYLSGLRLVRLIVTWVGVLGVLTYGFQISPGHVVLVWVGPLVLSSLQLFIFGTYLPHRRGGHNRHQAVSSPYPVWLSFLTCYHLGYHWEHHEYPHIPWYRLPTVRFWGSA